MTNNNPTSNTALVADLVAYLNSDDEYFKNHKTAEINALAAKFIASGEMIEHPGNPYTYAIG